MKTEDIKKMAQAWNKVQEASAQTRALASVKAQPKDKVSLAKAPWEKEKEVKKEAMDPVDTKALKGKYKDRKDKDIDNDGDTDSSDEYLHKRRKAISKASDDNIKMNPTAEGVNWPVYHRILENRNEKYKSAAPADPMDKGQSPGGKKMKADVESGAEYNNYDEMGHDDASKAGRITKKSPARNGDANVGDKSVVNPVKDTTK